MPLSQVKSRHEGNWLHFTIQFEGESRTVDMHIKTLRKKLGDSSKHIKTVRNVGYVME